MHPSYFLKLFQRLSLFNIMFFVMENDDCKHSLTLFRCDIASAEYISKRCDIGVRFPSTISGEKQVLILKVFQNELLKKCEIRIHNIFIS